MAFNAYLLFGVKGNLKIGGESTSDLVAALFTKDANNVGAIELSDFGFGVSMPVTTSRSDGGGATVGRANFDVFTASKNIDTATCSLMEYCCKGTNIERIVLHLFRSGDNANASGVQKYAMYIFGNCVITKVAISGSGEELPKESLEFNYGQCEYHYQWTNHESGLTDGVAAVSSGWSLIQNKKMTSGEKLKNEIKAVDANATWS